VGPPNNNNNKKKIKWENLEFIFFPSVNVTNFEILKINLQKFSRVLKIFNKKILG
jgi:hypothetical protein